MDQAPDRAAAFEQDTTPATMKQGGICGNKHLPLTSYSKFLPMPSFAESTWKPKGMKVLVMEPYRSVSVGIEQGTAKGPGGLKEKYSTHLLGPITQ